MVTTTTLSPSFWHYDVSTGDWGKVSPARGLYYYIESQYLTIEVSTYHLGQVSTAKGLLLHWVPVSDTMCQYTWLRQSFYCLYTWSQYTSLRPRFYCYRSVLLHWVPVSDTMVSVIMTEAKFLLLGVCTTTLGPSIWQWSKYLFLRPSSTARGQYNYIESKYLTHEVSTHHWGQVSTVRGQYYYIESLFLTQWCQYTSLRPRFYF